MQQKKQPAFEEIVPGREYKAMSLFPMWAWAILYGGKDIENRGRRTNYRGRILVHASSKKTPAHEVDSERAYLCELAGISSSQLPAEFQRSAILGSVELVDCIEDAQSPWASPGAVHWVLREPRLLREPVRDVNGWLQVWTWTAPGGSQVASARPAAAHASSHEEAAELAAPTPSASADEQAEDEQAIVLAALRTAASSKPANEVDVLRAASRQLGFARMGSRIEEGLRSHLRTALRRRILARDGQRLVAGTRSAEDYDLDTLVAAIAAVTRRGQTVERPALLRLLASYFGFGGAAGPSADGLSRAIDAAIGRGLLALDGQGRIRRAA